MKEIKFRGKSIKDGKWLYGYLGEVNVKILQRTCVEKVIFENLGWFNTDNFGYVVGDCEVDEETICQYTGLKDKHGNEIYAGDILHVIEYENKATMVFKDGEIQELDLSLDEARGEIKSEWHGTVECEESCMFVGDMYLDNLFGDMRYSNPIFDFEVIGNIHDNKLLID